MPEQLGNFFSQVPICIPVNTASAHIRHLPALVGTVNQESPVAV